MGLLISHAKNLVLKLYNLDILDHKIFCHYHCTRLKDNFFLFNYVIKPFQATTKLTSRVPKRAYVRDNSRLYV